MSDFLGNQARYRRASALVAELVATPRALSADEAQLLAIDAYRWRHLAASMDARHAAGPRVANLPPYLRAEAELRPEAPCPLCEQVVRVALPEAARG